MNKTILITGGTGKVGAQLVEYFHKLGLNVVFTSRSQDKINSLINNRNGIIGIKVNLLQAEAIPEILESLMKLNLEVNYLLNNARSLDSLKVEDDSSIKREHFLNEFLMDVVVPSELSFELAKKTSLEKIINISSIYGINSFNYNLYDGKTKFCNQYATAKAALIQLTKCQAVQFAEKDIQVNCVSYGGIEGRTTDEFKEKYAKLCPQKRMLKEEEVIGAIAFLISENSRSITGQNIVVDGGWTIW